MSSEYWARLQAAAQQRENRKKRKEVLRAEELGILRVEHRKRPLTEEGREAVRQGQLKKWKERRAKTGLGEGVRKRVRRDGTAVIVPKGKHVKDVIEEAKTKAAAEAALPPRPKIYWD